jgi:hypothetical protein
MDPAPDPAIFGLDVQAANKKIPVFFSLLRFESIRTSNPDPDPDGQNTYESTALKEPLNNNQQDVYAQ